MDAKPVVVWQIPDEAWKNVAQGISQVVEMLLAKPRFTIYIPQKLYTELMMHLMSNYPKAARGILGILGSTKVVKHYPTANAAENYVGDLKALINVDDITRIMNDIDDYDGDPIFYYSRPYHNRDAYPSDVDISWAKKSGYPYLIFSLMHYPRLLHTRSISYCLAWLSN